MRHFALAALAALSLSACGRVNLPPTHTCALRYYAPAQFYGDPASIGAIDSYGAEYQPAQSGCLIEHNDGVITLRNADGTVSRYED